jgi:hypothetical protein
LIFCADFRLVDFHVNCDQAPVGYVTLSEKGMILDAEAGREVDLDEPKKLGAEEV